MGKRSAVPHCSDLGFIRGIRLTGVEAVEDGGHMWETMRIFAGIEVSYSQHQVTVEMQEYSTKRARRPMLPATASSVGVGHLRLGSEHSRAAVRALLVARQESAADSYWDKELDCSGLADRIKAARERAERGEVRDDWEPISIPLGKANSVRGQLAARINRAKARMRQNETR